MTFPVCCAELPDGVWSKWTAWSECSKTCFNFVDEVGIRQRFRTCNRTVDNLNYTHSVCEGPGEEQEPCNTVQCPGRKEFDSQSFLSGHIRNNLIKIIKEVKEFKFH